MTSQSTRREARAAWDARADEARFSHPLHVEPLRQFGVQGMRVLELGCGYGRTLRVLADEGWRGLGCEPSWRMLERARRDGVVEPLVQADGQGLPFARDGFDAALLQAVLTSVPDLDDQRALVAELRRVLRPGGLLQVSDLLLQENARNQARYDEFAEAFGRRGAFVLPDGGVFRHHDREWFDELLAGFETLVERPLEVRTMNGNTARAWQWTGRLVESSVS